LEKKRQILGKKSFDSLILKKKKDKKQSFPFEFQGKNTRKIAIPTA
jgi:hypothetical protein